MRSGSAAAVSYGAAASGAAQAGLADQHSETEQERRRGAALMTLKHLSCRRSPSLLPLLSLPLPCQPALGLSSAVLPFLPAHAPLPPSSISSCAAAMMEQSTLRREARPIRARCLSRTIKPALSNRAIRCGRRR